MNEDITMRDRELNPISYYPSPSSFDNRSSSDQHQVLGSLGSQVKKLVHTITKLSLLGIESETLPLPKIVVVGEQSAGKSSLIEAISGIRVPRKSGVCTKCPLQINISDNSEGSWLCNILLDKKYDYFPTMTTESKHSSFGPWQPKSEPTSYPFKTVHNTEELEKWLSEAQLATLNPAESPTARSTGPRGTTTQVPFSPNIVRLDISGPGLTNLSFYDLPGVISQAETESEPYVVKLVKNLVKSYIREENALVLLVCAMEGDIANSSAAKLVDKLDAKNRCIGVITKPDRLQSGDHIDVWQEVLEGKKFRLGHGYFVAKQPSQRELDEKVTHAQAKEKELEFFASIEPWNTTFKKFHTRLGTNQLHAKLSELLVQQIQESLPYIKEQIHEKLEDVREKLNAIPKPVKQESLRIVWDLMSQFKTSIEQAMKGEHPFNEFKQEWEHVVALFQQALKDMKPLLHTKLKDSKESWATSSGPNPVLVQREPIEILSDDESPRQIQISPSKRRQDAGHPSPQKRIRTSQPRASRNNAERCAYLLEEVRKVLRQTTSSQIPGMADPKAVEILIAENTNKWHVAIDRFFEATKVGIKAKIEDIVKELLHQWSTTLLKKEVDEHVENFLEDAFLELREALDRALEFEVDKPMTYNGDWLNQQERAELQILSNARFNTRALEYLKEKDEISGRVATDEERSKKVKSVTAEQLGPDSYAKEIEIMSKVRGYYNVAYARLVDHTCQATHVKIFRKCQTRLPEYLKEALKLYQSESLETCSRLLAEDTEREQLRHDLQKEKEKLEKAERELIGLT